MNDQFAIRCDFSFPEYLRMNFGSMIRMKMLRSLFYILTGVSVLRVLLEWGLVSDSKINIFHAFVKLLMLPGFLLLFLLVFTILFSLFIFKLKPHWVKGNQYLFNNWGLEKTGAGKDFSAQWGRFIKYRESSRFIFLYINDNISFPIQKRMFDNEDQLQSFRQFIEKKIRN